MENRQFSRNTKCNISKLYKLIAYFPCSLNRNGIETHTDTGPFFIIAGVKTHCMAASVAG
jgi:hypothetical protein